MTKLSDLVGRPVTPEVKERQEPNVELVTKQVVARSQKPHDQFEAAVLTYLWANKKSLGVRRVERFTNLLVDGGVELNDGRRLTIEVKYRMNWEKACQAEYQFRNFMKRADRRPYPVVGGIVVFEEFSGDWDRRPAIRQVTNGWNFWYMSHADVEGLRLDLLQLRGDRLEGYPSPGVIPVVEPVLSGKATTTGRAK